MSGKIREARARAPGVLRLRPWVVIGMLAVALPAPAGALGATSASERASVAAAAPGDQVATRALLTAEYELVKAVLSRASAMEAAEARTAEALGRECKGVLRGVPDKSAIEEEGPRASPPRLSGRAQGERARSEKEKQTIDLEVDETIFAPANRVLRHPIAAYLAIVGRLTWGEPTINALVRQRAAELREDLAGPSVAVCAEMRTWAASGFHLLPPGSKRLQAANEARDKQAEQGNLGVLLRPHEDPAARAIVWRIDALQKRLVERELKEERFQRAEYQMEKALGQKLSRSAKERVAPVIAKGRTSAGTTFVVRRSVVRGRSGSCRHNVEVEVQERNGGNSGGVCLSDGDHSRPSGVCSGPVETVELATPPDVRRARVQLSDGRTVVVRVVRVSAKEGGPAGVFIDAFRGYNPYPVSVQELSRNGRVLRTVSLRFSRCKKEPTADAPRATSVSQSRHRRNPLR